MTGLSALTLFEAYKSAREWKESIEHFRGNSCGIAFPTGPLARRWQRYDRQSRRFEAALRERLTEIDEYFCNAEQMRQRRFEKLDDLVDMIRKS